MAEVTKDLCDARHGELLNALQDVANDVREIVAYIHGNGKPGLRQTQTEVQQLRADLAAMTANRQEIIYLVARPVVTAMVGGAGGLLVFLLSLYFSAK